MVVPKVVRWRRYGDGGQESRPGTKAYRGGTKVYVIDAYPGMGHEELTTIGQARGNRRWITIDTGTRHLHSFRVRLVYAPAVLRRWQARRPQPFTREYAEELAATLERLAVRYRQEHHGDVPHPDPCLCHECLKSASE